MTTTVTALQNDTIDALCWRHLGTTAGGVVEQAMALNQDLITPVLAEGTQVSLPDKPSAAATTLDTVNLWD